MQLNLPSLNRLSNLLTGIGRKNIPVVHNLGLLLKAIELQSDNLNDLKLLVETWKSFLPTKLIL